MKRHTQTLVIGMLFFGSILAGGLPAQQTTTSTPPPAGGGSTEEHVVHLNPFEVTTTHDIGYQATETLAGTRIRTNLADVSASISVVTSEFLKDIGATNSLTLLEYTPNAQMAGTEGTYAGVGNGQTVDESGNLRAPGSAQRVRGLAAADNARDYYITDIPWDSFNTDRVDILRGPNSILFGLGSPAGIVNNSLHNAEFRDFGSVEGRTGSYGSARGSIDLNKEFIPQVLAVRVDGLWDDTKYEQKPAFNNDKRVYGSVRFDPQIFRNRAFQTSFKLKYEHGEVNANRPRTLPPTDAITMWWNPVMPSTTNPFGGMGKQFVNNLYDVWRTGGVVAGNGRGLIQNTTVNYLPWLSNGPNQQQPYWLIDGATNQTIAVNGGYINNGAISSTGTYAGIAAGIYGKGTNDMFYGLGSLNSVVNGYHNWNSTLFPDAQYGQYRSQSLLDPTVFDFYNTLIDGPNKMEFEQWNSYNIDFTQTGWDGRIGVDFSYDRQKYKRGGEALFGGNPTLTLDVLKNFLDYYVAGVNPVTGTQNPNLGRPYVSIPNNAFGGNSFYTDREYKRASLFGELRVSDLTSNNFLVKLLGKHQFNAVAADEKYYNEQRRWQIYANSKAWDGYWNNNDGSTHSFLDRPPLGYVYLGGPVTSRDSASGAHIPGVSVPISMQNSGVYVFDETWKGGNLATPVLWNAPWDVPANLYTAYNGLPSPDATTELLQATNPANYVGWNSNFQDNLLRYNGGQDNSLLTLAQKQLRETISYAGSYQGYFWNNALVATLGWRYDEVKTKDVTAQQQPGNRSILNLSPNVYSIEGGYPHNKIFKGHSTSGGAVLHLNSILPHDPLPINVSLGYDESSNFQVTSARVDVYGNVIGNPTGKTYEYNVLLSTKDGKYSFRAVKYTTRVKNGSSTLSNSGALGSIIGQGLRWRNVFLYQLSGYEWSTRNSDQPRNNWTNAWPLGRTNVLSPTTPYTAAQAQHDEDAAITTWNNIQKTLEGTSYFRTWNFTPVDSSVLTDRTTYLANPANFTPPNTLLVTSYTSTQPQNFAVTSDMESKGYELELTANPLPNWRLAFNASKAQAVQSNVGGAATTQFVNYINSQLINPDGTLTPAGAMTQFGNPTFSLYPNIWGPFMASWTLLKLQENADVAELRKWRYNVTTNYQFPSGFLNGHLKGVGVGGAYRWIDKVVIGYPVLSGGSFATYDFSKPYFGPSEGYLDLWVSYERKLTKGIDWRVQLNVRNVGKRDALLPVSVEPDGHTWATVRTQPVQEWFVTNTLSF